MTRSTKLRVIVSNIEPMNKLEKKIIKGIFSYETRHTLLSVVFRLLAILSFTLAGIIWAYFIIQELIYQQTWDIFEIFREDLAVIRENIWEVLGTFSEEIPKIDIILAVCTLVLAVYLALKFVKNFAKVKNRIKSIIKFWFKR